MGWTCLLGLANSEIHSSLQRELLCRASSTDRSCRKINWSPNTASSNFSISLVSVGRFSIGLLSSFSFFFPSPPHSGITANPQHSSWLSPELTRNILIDSIYRLKNLGLEAANQIFPLLALLCYLSIYLSIYLSWANLNSSFLCFSRGNYPTHNRHTRGIQTSYTSQSTCGECMQFTEQTKITGNLYFYVTVESIQADLLSCH